MYPTFYRNLWNPRHGIAFAPARQDETSYPVVDMLRSLHSTGPPANQTNAAVRSDEEFFESDDDAPFSTPPEYQGTLDTTPIAQPSTSVVNGVIKESESAAVSTDMGPAGPSEPPCTNLEFKISLKDFREAQGAAKESAKSFWSYTLYRGPPEDGVEKKVKVHYCKSKHTMERVCQYFVNDKVLGVDLEWFPDARKDSGPKKNVSLIQVANESRIALFHIALFPNNDFEAPTFRKIMENADVKKVGVAIKGDCTRMRTHLGVDTKGIFELSHLYKLVKYSANGRVGLINKRLVSLASLVQENLGLPMFKGSDVRSSDWSQPLNMSQIMYSASDAYAGFQLYHVLEGKRESLDPIPPRPHDAELNRPIRLADGQFIAAADDNAEAIDSDDRGTTTALSYKHVEAIKASLEIEPEGGGPSIAESIRSASAVSPQKRQKDPRVAAADEQLARYRTTIKTLRATPSAVRSYYIWRNNADLTPEAIAKVLRDPPLQTNTVVSYILEAIKLEKLPFDKKRLRNEILHLLPKDVLQGRYKALTLEAHKPDTDTSSVA
ncbi:3'-5' exonuclease [Colletotrichum graminicola]|uniref:3'-5' exonuclease n=1 Tax=Colletotrichum graminicola (strain M1.001 / M2 / FGSC 10212) TaxID=645133 RepID=E3QAI3_COLGM|nr:3'-5' exonuclease [Colletotrichum graminicola M1.001]EFQ27871.1 3'-5' exonuclease [Colletotrichum graminicola M1.001]WDK12224.1 3'-5' exonuclease [Colletotrichum graminicola]